VRIKFINFDTDHFIMGKKERSKRKRTLIRKMIEYSLLFDVDIMIITRDKETKQQKLFRPTHRGVDAHWMPDLEVSSRVSLPYMDLTNRNRTLRFSTPVMNPWRKT
jgi:hypothetical protein